MDYVFGSSFCDGPNAGGLALLAFRRSSVDVDWSTTTEMQDPFVWYNYQTGDVISLPVRVAVVGDPGQHRNRTRYPHVAAQLKSGITHATRQGCIDEAIAYRSKSSRVAPSRVTRAAPTASFSAQRAPVQVPASLPAARLGPSMPAPAMDDDDEVTPVPTIPSNTLMAYDPSRTSRISRKKATRDQSFDMLLQTYTKKCAEIDYATKELDKAKATIANLEATVSRLRRKDSGSSSSQDGSPDFELEVERLKLERDEALAMKDTANTRAAASAISLRKANSALTKLQKEFDAVKVQIDEFKNQLSGLSALPDDHPVFVELKSAQAQLKGAQDDLKKVSDERDGLAAEKAQLEARFHELTAAHAVAVAKISEVDRLRAAARDDKEHIKSIERALLHTRGLVHSRAHEDVNTLNKMLRGLKSMTNDLTTMKAVALADREHAELLVLPDTNRINMEAINARAVSTSLPGRAFEGQPSLTTDTDNVASGAPQLRPEAVPVTAPPAEPSAPPACQLPSTSGTPGAGPSRAPPRKSLASTSKATGPLRKSRRKRVTAEESSDSDRDVDMATASGTDRGASPKKSYTLRSRRSGAK